MATSKAMNDAKKAKKDEFYTIYEDIAAELPNYKEQLKGKRIICPCDWDESFAEALVYKEEGYVAPTDLISVGGSVKRIDIEQSKERIERDLTGVKCNFVKFLVAHAEAYGIKSISVSGYNPDTGEGVKFQDVDYSKYDIVITNPPFSLFRDFIDVMFKNDIKFLIIGPTNAITYLGVFGHIQNNEMWLGYHHHMTGFVLPNGDVLPKNDALVRYCCWYTNLDVSYRHDRMILTESYDSAKYPTYCNYDGIDVNKTSDIPYDYDGNMGVPITFLQKYNPEQFQILGISRTLADPIPDDVPKKLKGGLRFYLKDLDGNYVCLFERLVIKNKEVFKNDDAD